MDRGPRTGVTEAVFQSDLDIGQGVGADTRVRLLRAGPWFWDCRRWWGVIVFERLLFLWTEGNGKTSIRRIARGLKTICHSYHSVSKPNQIWQL